MAHIFASAIGGKAMMAFWYHFAILFEALFILTAVDAGTRAGRFMLQDLLGVFAPAFRNTASWGSNIVATALCVTAWGYFLYQGVTDPLGGVNTLWPLFGISNQMLAAVALTLCTVVIFRMKRERYAWVTVVPTVWLAACTLTVGASRRARAHVAHEPVDSGFAAPCCGPLLLLSQNGWTDPRTPASRAIASVHTPRRQSEHLGGYSGARRLTPAVRRKEADNPWEPLEAFPERQRWADAAMNGVIRFDGALTATFTGSGRSRPGGLTHAVFHPCPHRYESRYRAHLNRCYRADRCS
jgi:5TM C-terminal transporter carbon starvation CstA